MRVRLTWAIVALAIAACGQPQQGASTKGAQASAGGPPADAPAWVRDQWATLPDWDFVANISEGGKASFSPRSIRRSAGMADVQVQVLHLQPVPYRQETASTIETTWFFKERAAYRFNCPARSYVVVQRDYMGTGDKVVGTDRSDPASEADWRPIDGSGLAKVLEGPVCKAA